jgi:hypothetical protein
MNNFRIDQQSPIMIRNLFFQKRKKYLKYFFPLPAIFVNKQIEKYNNLIPSYMIENSENRTSYIITVSFKETSGKRVKITKQCKSFYIPISSIDLGRLLPPNVKTCGIIINDDFIKIIVPVSQWDKRELNSILKMNDIFTFNFKKKDSYQTFM